MPRSAPSAAQATASEPSDASLLTVTVQNFGPIAKAAVEIKPLTILVGRSNTGKTYFSKLIYAFHKSLSGFPQIPFFERHYNFPGSSQSLESLIAGFSTGLETEQQKQEILNHIFRSFELNRDSGCNQILTEIEQCFGTRNILNLRHAHSKQKDFKINTSYRRVSENIWNISIESKNSKPSINTKFNPHYIEFAGSAYEDLVFEIEQLAELNYLESKDESDGIDIFDIDRSILEFAYPGSGTRQSSYFLPANRGGILESHKIVADSWLEKIPQLGLRHFSPPQPLPKISVDFIRTMLMSEGRSREFPRKSARGGFPPLAEIAKFIEDELIDGNLKIKTSTHVAYPVIKYVPSHAKRSLKLDAASSMVSELAPIIVIARSHLNPFDLLIIEEPEAHLHPGALPLVAKCLAMLVRNNVRVLITTHSDWLLKSLRNLILEGDLVQMNSNQNSTDDDYLLRREVGAWEFSAGSDLEGTTVSEIMFDDLDGIEPSEIERISDDLYNESVAIRNARARRQR